MPKSKLQERIYALITILLTVPCFVFYCLSIENSGILNVDFKFALILIPIEFILAYCSEIFFIGPIVNKLVFKKVNPKKYQPLIIECAIICTTVALMCPWMSFLATILDKGIFPGMIFNEVSVTLGKFFIHFIPNFLQTVVLNFPFAILTQLFYIQPLTRTIFKFLCKKK